MKGFNSSNHNGNDKHNGNNTGNNINFPDMFSDKDLQDPHINFISLGFRV